MLLCGIEEYREVHMLCIVALLGLWCIHANARVVAEF